MRGLTTQIIKRGFAALDQLLPKTVTLIVGGGGAMMLAHSFPLSTVDVDAVPRGLSSDELKPYIEDVAKQLGLVADWLNPWFGSFTHVLPTDYAERLIEVYAGPKLRALALGRDDLLLMKCFAHRKKDIPHARALVRAGAKIKNVYDRIDELEDRKIPGTELARDFLEQIVEMEED
jgi:hypothetical protein